MAQFNNPFLRGQYGAQAANQSAEQAELQGLATLLRLKQMQEEQPYRMDALRGATADRESQARYRDAQIQEMQRKAAGAAQQQGALGGLVQLLATGGYRGVEGAGAPPPTSVAPTDDAALAQFGMRKNPDGSISKIAGATQPTGDMSVNVPNPGLVQGLAVAADPQRAILEILRQQRPEKQLTPRQQYTPVAGGYLDETGVFHKTAEPPARPEPTPSFVVTQDKNSPTGWSHRNTRTGELSPGAPPPGGGRESNDNIRRVMQFGAEMNKSDLPQSYANLEEAATLIGKPGVLNYLTGPGSFVPDAALSKDVTDARQALQRVLNITLKQRSGAAVTVQEWERFKKEVGVGLLKKPEQIPEALRQAKTILDKYYQAVAAGYPEDVRNRYFQEMGSVAPYGTQSSQKEQPATSDDDLINKYLKR